MLSLFTVTALALTSCETSPTLTNASAIVGDPNAAPVASFTVNCVGPTCSLDASASHDPDGTIVAFEWDLPGKADTGQAISHAFLTPGSHPVTLLVRDDLGATSTARRTVHVTERGPANWIYPGDDAQAVVDAHPAGTEFIIKAGLHRHFSVRARVGDTFRGEPGAVVSGAKTLTGFTRSGALWSVSGQSQQNPTHDGTPHGSEVCSDGSDGLQPVSSACIFPEDLFVDGRPLVQVTSIAQLGPGKWYFDYVADEIYLYDDPAGHTVETSVIWEAFGGNFAHDVTIENLVVEKYANAAQHGAIDFRNSDRVRILGNEVRLNHGAGIKVTTAAEIRIIGNYVHHNGELGIGTYRTTDTWIEDNEVSDNNFAGYSGFWEAGGLKLVGDERITVSANRVNRNNGKGIWFDIAVRDGTVDGNTVDDNTQQGIFVEISYGAVVRYNTLSGNGARGSWFGRSGIAVNGSPDVEIHHNVVSGSPNGILAAQTDRGSGPDGPYVLKNLFVHDNTITMTSGGTGVLRSSDVSDDVFRTANNRFEANTYHLGPGARYFRWLDSELDEASWRAAGHDLTGTFNRP